VVSESDLQLIQDFMRTVKAGNGLALEVGIVTWPSVSQPSMKWQLFREWFGQPSERELAQAKKDALHTRKFFKICQICRERCNTGHMHDARTCQTCAGRCFGVVY
jgi:hypothetical protein